MAENRKVGARLNIFFFWIMLFLFMNFVFSWFSPGWTNTIGAMLIGDEKSSKPEAEVTTKSIGTVNPIRTVKFLHFGNIELKTSMKTMKPRELKYLCDRKPETVLQWPKAEKGDCVVLKYKQSFKCSGISLRVEAADKFRGLLQTSTDGIVFSTVKVLAKGANDIPLKGENVKALRIMLYANTPEWKLGDINCR